MTLDRSALISNAIAIVATIGLAVLLRSQPELAAPAPSQPEIEITMDGPDADTPPSVVQKAVEASSPEPVKSDPQQDASAPPARAPKDETPPLLPPEVPPPVDVPPQDAPPPPVPAAPPEPIIPDAPPPDTPPPPQAPVSPQPEAVKPELSTPPSVVTAPATIGKSPEKLIEKAKPKLEKPKPHNVEAKHSAAPTQLDQQGDPAAKPVNARPQQAKSGSTSGFQSCLQQHASRYPTDKDARLQQPHGTVGVAVTLAGGEIVGVAITASAGPILDRAAKSNIFSSGCGSQAGGASQLTGRIVF